MTVLLDNSCVYTIAMSERLLAASKSGEPLFEEKRWVTAATLLHDARNMDHELPIIFADSRNNAAPDSALIAWSVIRSINVTATGTFYAIGPLWTVPPARPQDLQLLSSEAQIAEGYRRNYALCRIPGFLFRQAKSPRLWSQLAFAKKEAHEGKRRMAAHMRLERSAALVAALKKDRIARNNGRLPCEVCGFDFLETYGPVGAGFAEAHHKDSLAKSPKNGRITTLDDLAVVCSNCHRMLHRSPEYPSIESLRNRVRQARKKAQLRT